MIGRSVAATLLTTTAAVLVLCALTYSANVDLAHLWATLRKVHVVPVLVLVSLFTLNAVLAAEKWRIVEECLTKKKVSRRLCIALTALGGALGQILPMQVATAATRATGIRVVRGSGALRGGLGTLFEQSFDIITMIPLAAASLACVALNSVAMWPVLAGSALLATILTAGPAAAHFDAVLARTESGGVTGRSWRSLCARLSGTGLLEPRLLRGLILLSTARFVVLCAAAVATTQAIGSSIPTIDLAAAMPIVVLATGLSMVPGGLGVNELTFGVTLAAFGSPLAATLEWALANRVLTAVASTLIGAAGAAAIPGIRGRGIV